jgi:enoyl-CoA hydratase/carnithine racemase
MAMEGLRHIRHEMKEGGIAVLTLHRPPVNAIGREVVEDLNTACAWLENSGDVRVVILAADGKAFSAGADLKERQTMTEDDVRAWLPFLSGTFTRFAGLPMPTIACIQGVAAGGGLELALACDLRVAEEEATLGLREVALAIIPGAGGTQRLPRLIGEARAKKWIFTGRIFTAAEALEAGVVDQIAKKGKGLDAAMELAGEIAANGPLALDDGLKAEQRAYESIIPTEDRVEAIRAFKEKRKPDFKGR